MDGTLLVEQCLSLSLSRFSVMVDGGGLRWHACGRIMDDGRRS